MIAIARQVKANLLSRRIAAGLIFITLAAAATLLTVGVLTAGGVGRAFDREFEQARGAHLNIYLETPDEALARKAADDLGTIPGVTASTGLLEGLYNNLYFHEQHDWVVVFGLGLKLPEVSRPLLVAGRYFQEGDGDVVLLDSNLAYGMGIQVGDKVEYQTSEGNRLLTVIGLVLNPYFGPYPNWRPAHIFVPDNLFPALKEISPNRGYQVGLRLEDPDAVQNLWVSAKERWGDLLGGTYSDWRDVRYVYNMLLRATSVFLVAFSAVAMLSAGFIIVATIGGAVLAQYRSIGLWKAIGYTGSQVVGLFVLENAFLGFFAAAAGLILGAILSPLLMESASRTLNTAPSPAVNLQTAVLVIGLVILLAVLFSAWPAWRGSRIDTIQAIRLGSEAPRAGSSRLTRIAARMGMPPVVSLGLKDVFSKPFRTALLSGIVAIGVLGMVFGVGMGATISLFVDNPELMLGIKYDATFWSANPSEMSYRQAFEFLSARDDIQGVAGVLMMQLTLPETEEQFHARFLEGDIGVFHLNMVEGRAFSAPGEAIAGQGLLTMTGKAVGDDLDVILELVEMRGDEMTKRKIPLTLHIVGSYSSMENSGKMLITSMETLNKAGLDVEPLQYYVRFSAGADADAVIENVKSESGGRILGEVQTTLEPPVEIAQLRVVVGALAGVLSLITLLGVFNAAWMTIRERSRDFGVFKVVGLTPVQVVATVFVGTAALVLVVTAVCLPLGVLGTPILINAIAEQFGYPGTIPLATDWAAVALVPLGALAVAGLGCLIPAFHAARVKVAEVLRYE